MATIHTSGTQLENQVTQLPLNKAFLASLAVVFLLAMHFFMPNPGGSGLALSFNPTTWLALSFTLAIGFYQLATNRVLKYSKLTVGLLISCVILTLPTLYSNAFPQAASGRLLGLWAGFALFVVLQQFKFSNKHKQRMLWFIVLAVVIQALFGYVQYFLLEPGNLFGYNTAANRPYGIFQQPNVMASFLATGFVLSAYLLARQPAKYNHKISESFLLYLTPTLTVPLLIIIASRTGWLAAIIGFVCILPYLYKFSTKKRFYGWCSSVLLGVVVGFTVINLQSVDSLASQKASRSHLEDARGYIFPQALDMMIEKPFTGYGYGKFESEYTLYTARQHQLNPNYHPGLPSMDHPHNEFLFWGVEGGIVPIIGILIAAFLVMSRIASSAKGTRLALLALFIPILLHSQLEYPFYHSAIHWITFIILIYWVDQRASRHYQQPFSIVSKTLFRVSSLVVPILVSFYMLSALHTNYVLTQFELSKPRNPDILKQVTNPVVWKDRYDWDVYSTYLNIGLYKADPSLIQPYIDWSLEIIKRKPRPAFYSNLILAYQGLGDHSKAEQIRSEASFLFPNRDFSKVQYKKISEAENNISSAK
ncbi:PglL family O-oligosaccharyltransferase [Vibrio splendidus]|uniref:PglL family O-oligosaccharyltransferase n=1 Tax=Vibrio splendidus TaxID=29497 RepID=UPI0024689A7B|nr:PglL family O-oligosaccharyltransferase [Vibrio splendidus]MDH6025896.1 PglL family O-oligosaccharyltransferase [Vibrio splendidus]